MSPETIIWSLIAASTGSCLVAGVFLSFSDFTMRSLNLATREAASHTMQILNREVFRSVFIVLLVGMTPVAVIIGGLAVVWPPQTGLEEIALGSLSYVLGVFCVTMFGNVPRNKKLAAMVDGSPEAQAYWPIYYKGWMFWNHVRTICSLATALCYMDAAVLIAIAL